ncbi:hypothetical protein DERF_008525 [Dermatophagoides farinae]|uniref:Uncharacterized protein n=1 Tax=Dermatophagoides farinae TaxID=6954 RepID=A0A922I3E7_DERFA|nr:hypothetical protein DERF_008525 [Dermatophagoides farinae]
MAERPQIYVQ